MIRSVLVALDSGENMDIVLKYGLELAQYFESEVHGIHVLDVRKLYSPFMEDVLYSAGLSSVPNLQALVRERMEKLKSILHSQITFVDKVKAGTEIVASLALVADCIVAQVT